MATLVPLRLRRLVDTFLDVLLPRTCVACREIVEEPAAVCRRCATELAALPVPEPFQVEVAGGKPVQVQALFPFTDPARELVHALKYQNRRDAAQPLAELAAARFGPELVSAILVPIPLHARRERARGYNQSAVLAAAIAEATGARCCRALVRKRATRSQTRLGRDARAANVSGAFGLARSGLPEPASVVLVDDVATTGATLAEAASVLRAAGAQYVLALTAAREL